MWIVIVHTSTSTVANIIVDDITHRYHSICKQQIKPGASGGSAYLSDIHRIRTMHACMYWYCTFIPLYCTNITKYDQDTALSSLLEPTRGARFECGFGWNWMSASPRWCGGRCVGGSCYLQSRRVQSPHLCIRSQFNVNLQVMCQT